LVPERYPDHLREIVVLVNCVEPFSAMAKVLVDTRIEALFTMWISVK
jgi:hypothetical protein